MNKVNLLHRTEVEGDVWKIIEANGIVADEVIQDDKSGWRTVVRGDLCLKWGTWRSERSETGVSWFEFSVKRAGNGGWHAECMLDDRSWTGGCDNNAPPTILNYFQVYGVSDNYGGLGIAFLGITFQSYEAGLEIIRRIVEAFVNYKP